MKYHFKVSLCLTAALYAPVFAQSPSSSSERAVSNPVAAYVYVTRTVPGGSENEIAAFSAAPDGKLTPLSGSPFQENVTSMAANGKFLFAANSNKVDIDSYRIAPTGALSYATTTSIAAPHSAGALGPMFFDRTGETLYDMEINGGGYNNNTYQSFTVDAPVGALDDMGNSSDNSWLSLPATFIGNNVFAYTASCLQDMYWGIYGFQRGSSGLLSEIAINADPPTPPDGYFYCPSQTATGQDNHVVIAMQPVNQSDFEPDRPPQLATYTADDKGNLSTTSTHSNMPESSVVKVKDMKMSPSGNLLAVAGNGGLQIFRFNGSVPITRYTGLLTKDEIDQCFWDNQNHLYSISRNAGKLYVFTITPTSYVQAPGSPYTIAQPHHIVVQPEP
jgi:hypothetical protein